MTLVRTFRTIGIYASLAILVLVLGLLAGWYLYLRKETQNTSIADTARGYSTEVPESTVNGSTYANINAIVGAVPSQTAPEPSPAKSPGFFSGIISWITGKNTGITDTPHISGIVPSLAVDVPLVPSTTVKKLPRLYEIAKSPTAGFGFVTLGGKLSIYFAERATGYIFAADPESGKVTRLTNKLVPKTYEAYFSRAGTVLLRTIESGRATIFSGTISTSTAATSTVFSLSLVSLGQDIHALSVDPITTQMFTIGSDGVGNVSKWDGSKKRQVFSSIVGSWRPHFLSDGRMIVAESAEDYVSGYAYEIQKNGALFPLVRDAPGLTMLPQASSSALLYGTADEELSLFVVASTGASSVELPVKTTADKCTWSPTKGIAYCAVPIRDPGAGFIGAWYRGSIHTNDSWWRVDAGAGNAEKLFVTDDAAQQADVISPLVDPSGRYIVFLDNRDRSLWMLRIVE